MVLSTSRVGEKAATTPWALTLASRLARFNSLKRWIFSSSRAKAWATRTPEIFSSRSALTLPMVRRVSRKARRARRERMMLEANMKGKITKVASANCQLRLNIAARIPTMSNALLMVWTRPALSTWPMVSTSLVKRLIKSPASCSSKNLRDRLWIRSKMWVLSFKSTRLPMTIMP